MIRILYDNQIFHLQKFGGISRYFAELIGGLRKTMGIKIVQKRFYSENKHLRSKGLTYLDAFNDKYRFRGKLRIKNYVITKEKQKFSKAFRESRYDIFHPTYYWPVDLELMQGSKPLVLTVYDMIHELYYAKNSDEIPSEITNKRKLIQNATHIISISKSTKDDILHLYPEVDKNKISVIYLGSSLTPTKRLPKISLPSRYFLFVGNRNDYKNFLWLFNSMSDLLRDADLTLVCAGGKPFSEFEYSLIAESKLENKVLFVDINDDNDLAVLYQNALCFIFPSLLEGFGIPILEAFSCYCPVLLAASSCLPEVAENAAIYYEENNSKSLLEQLQNILDDPQLSMNLIKEGSKRLKFFNWQNTVNQHIELYKAIYKKYN